VRAFVAVFFLLLSFLFWILALLPLLALAPQSPSRKGFPVAALA
jgi:hypothetical protein